MRRVPLLATPLASHMVCCDHGLWRGRSVSSNIFQLYILLVKIFVFLVKQYFLSLKCFSHKYILQLAHEAVKCEEKEEKLVKDAVQHLTQANTQIKDLHHQFTHKVL